MNSTLPAEALAPVMERLRAANERFACEYPGDTGSRRPVHTVYGGAALFRAETTSKLGALALKSLEQNASSASEFAEALGLSSEHADSVFERVRDKLLREPVED